MAASISGAQYPLSKIFSSDFSYEIPSYQRPYSWGVDQTAELFDDLFDFHSKVAGEEYFLGSIVLIKEDGQQRAEVIDGQQRLTTLTILLACMAERITDAGRDQFMNYIREPGNAFEELDPKPRLTLRPRDREFFSNYVQAVDLQGLVALDPAKLSESQSHIRANAALLRERLAESLPEDKDLVAFASFLVKRCVLVVVSTPSSETAFRVFSVMNSRGLDLLPTDIIKADVIGKLKESQRDAFNETWEDMEVEAGREGFEDVFRHIRMIYAKDKARRGLLEEFRNSVISRHPDPAALIENVLEPYSAAYVQLSKANYTSTADAAEINAIIRWLNRIEHSDWVPPAMVYLKRFGEDSTAVLDFLRKLERLSALLYLCGYYVNARIERMALLLADLEHATTASDELPSLELTDAEQNEFANLLRGDVYLMPARKRAYIVLRLDSFISDGAATYDPGVLTIEHILPQTVDPVSHWALVWPEEAVRQKWLHKLANLVPLTRARNSSAQNYDFDKKKDKYFKGSKGVTSYALTTQVTAIPDWTPELVSARQEELLAVMRREWGLR